LHENRVAITAWRDSLPEHRRRRLIGAQAVVKRWRKTTQPTKPKPTDLEQARTAWRRFVSCAAALPQDQSRLLWEIALPEVLGNLGMSAVPQQATSI
jgi:hypothetical protein